MGWVNLLELPSLVAVFRPMVGSTATIYVVLHDSVATDVPELSDISVGVYIRAVVVVGALGPPCNLVLSIDHLAMEVSHAAWGHMRKGFFFWARVTRPSYWR